MNDYLLVISILNILQMIIRHCLLHLLLFYLNDGDALSIFYNFGHMLVVALKTIQKISDFLIGRTSRSVSHSVQF